MPRAALERDDYAPHPDGKCGRIFCLDVRCRPAATPEATSLESSMSERVMDNPHSAAQARDAIVAALAQIPDVALPEDDDDLVAVVFDLAADTALEALRSLPVEQRMEAMGMQKVEIDAADAFFYAWVENE